MKTFVESEGFMVVDDSANPPQVLDMVFIILTVTYFTSTHFLM